jgi:hypothetical protein
MNKRSKMITGLSTLALMGAATATGMSATATASASASGHQHHGRHLHAHLDPLNNSGASGRTVVKFHGHRASVDIDARGLAKGLPHAQHIHFGADARHECPSVYDDTNNDHRLNVAEGLPAYGDIAASLTKTGPTDPGSALDLARFPTTPRGVEHYRRDITFDDRAVRKAIKRGQGVVVIHGVDYNGNGEYDMAGAGPSELNAAVPAEITDPALCGVLRVHRSH